MYVVDSAGLGWFVDWVVECPGLDLTVDASAQLLLLVLVGLDVLVTVRVKWC